MNSSLSTTANEITQEDREIAAQNSLLIDPFDKKINNLGPKSRVNWLKKIQQSFEENAAAANSSRFRSIDELCAKLEHEIFAGAKNLIIYQANCMKKITEIKNCTKEKRSYLAEYEAARVKKDASERQAIEAAADEDEKSSKSGASSTSENKNVNLLQTTSFTSALQMIKKQDLVVLCLN